MSLRARLAGITLSLVLVVYVLLGFVLYFNVSDYQWSRVDRTLEDAGRQTSRRLQRSPFGEFRLPPPQPFGETTPQTQILDRSGQPVATTFPQVGELPVDDATRALAERPSPGVALRTVKVDGVHVRIAAVSFDGGAVQTALVVDHVVSSLQRLLVVLVVGGSAAAVLVVVLTVAAVGLVLQRRDRMRLAAARVAQTEDTSLRIDVGGADETGRLAGAFNVMLERLQGSQRRLREALEAQRRFVEDASHELRSPLTSIRGNVEVLRRHPDLPTDERDTALGEVQAEAERLSGLCEELLVLARAENAGAKGLAEIVPAEIAAAAVASAARAAPPDRPVVLMDGSRRSRAVGDEESLRRILDALCENALVHGAGAIEVWVGAPDEAACLRLAVRDEGPGIPAPERDTDFRRFHRGREAHGRPGSGLGLAICASLARAMGGRIDATDRGIIVTLRAAGSAQGAPPGTVTADTSPDSDAPGRPPTIGA